MVNKIISILFLTCVFICGQAQDQRLTAQDTTTVIFKVHFASDQIPLNLNDTKYKDIPEITFYKDTANKVFRYTSGHFTKISDASDRKKLLVDMGIKDVFIMAFKNGRRIR
jgi:hypothetical protein